MCFSKWSPRALRDFAAATEREILRRCAPQDDGLESKAQATATSKAPIPQGRDGRYKFKSKFNGNYNARVAASPPHSQEWLCHESLAQQAAPLPTIM
jgi:hypothetical protein